MDPLLLRSWRRFALLFLLVISSVGGGALALSLAFLGVCVGAMGSDVNCSVKVLSGDFEELLVAAELGLLVAYSYLWLPLGSILILAAIYSFGFGLLVTLEAIR